MKGMSSLDASHRRQGKCTDVPSTAATDEVQVCSMDWTGWGGMGWGGMRWDGSSYQLKKTILGALMLKAQLLGLVSTSGRVSDGREKQLMDPNDA